MSTATGYKNRRGPWHSHTRRADCQLDCDPSTYEDFYYERKADRPERDESTEPLWVQGLSALAGQLDDVNQVLVEAEAALTNLARASGRKCWCGVDKGVCTLCRVRAFLAKQPETETPSRDGAESGA